MEENKPFAGRVFGITGNLDRDAIIAQIKAAGGTVSNTVHKRVSYLVCTEDAVTRNTQRVRKAAKFNVMVVSPAFVDDAVKSGTVPCAADYAVSKKARSAGVATPPVVNGGSESEEDGADGAAEEGPARLVTNALGGSGVGTKRPSPSRKDSGKKKRKANEANALM